MGPVFVLGVGRVHPTAHTAGPSGRLRCQVVTGGLQTQASAGNEG